MVTLQANQIDSICNDTHLIFAFTPTVKTLNPKSLIINNPQTLLNTRLHPQTLLNPRERLKIQKLTQKNSWLKFPNIARPTGSLALEGLMTPS